MTETTPYKNRVGSIVIRALLAGGVLWLLFNLIDPEQVYLSFQQADILFLVLAFSLVPVHLGLRVLRWTLLLRGSGIQEDGSYTLKVVLAGYAFSAVTPGEIGDIFVRTRFHSQVSGGTIPALVVLDKLLQGILILLVGGPSLVYVLGRSFEFALLIFLLSAGIVVVLGRRRKVFLRNRMIHRVAARFNVEQGVAILSEIPRRSILQVVVLSVVVLFIYVGQEYLLLNALAETSFSTAWIGYWSSMAVQMIFPFFLAGLGIREGAHVYFFGLLGIPPPIALTASLLLFTINIFIPSLLGILSFVALKNRVPHSS